MLNEIGQNVMISDIKEYYRLTEFFGQFKLKQLRVVMGVPTLEKVMEPNYYTHLKGGMLEAMGKLFASNTKLYVYPTLKGEALVTSEGIHLARQHRLLYDYLHENRFILDLNSDMSKQLHVKSREVLKMIQENNPEWEKYVPMIVAKTIKEKGLFKD